jgi:hypothetical protein
MADEKLLGRFEMLWDCSFCGKTKLLGITHRHCPECGGAQDQTKRYFPTDADKVAVKDDYAGHDRTCGSCNHANGAKATFCAGCGAPLDEAAAVKKRADQVVQKGQQFMADDALKAEAELTDRKTHEASGKPIARPVMAVKKKSWLWLYILLSVLVLFSLIWFMCIRKKAIDVVVDGQHWTKSIAIEEYKEVEHQDWQDRLPTKRTRQGNCANKQRDSKKVPDGQDCHMRRVDKGDGTFEEREECTTKYRSEPIYDTWCSYWVNEWTVIDTKEATADDGAEPAWPETGMKPVGLVMQGSRREGARTETFTVDLADKKGHAFHCDVGKDLWSKLTKGTAAKASVRTGSDEFVCGDLKPK